MRRNVLDETEVTMRKLHKRQQSAKQSKQASSSKASTEESSKKSQSTSVQSPIEAFFRTSNKKKTTSPNTTEKSTNMKSADAKEPSTSKMKNGSSDLNKKSAALIPEESKEVPKDNSNVSHSQIVESKSNNVIDLSP